MKRGCSFLPWYIFPPVGIIWNRNNHLIIMREPAIHRAGKESMAEQKGRKICDF
jgi:hypothetical protein